MTVRATVVIPTHTHGPLLLHSARSALSQTVRELELFIIGDGAPDTTRDIVRDLRHADPRVRFFDFPKGPRLGEAYRHDVLREANGAIVCYLSDDDLWFPNHLETMEALLQDADFAHALSLRVEPDGSLLPGNTVDFRIPGIRALAVSSELALGGAPLSCMAHTRDIYWQLPRGWHVTPEGIATNIHMTRQFVAFPACRLVNASQPTLLRFPSFSRRSWRLDRRLTELERWAPLVADAQWLAALPPVLIDVFARVSAERWLEIKRLELKIRTMQARSRRAKRALEEKRAHSQAQARQLETALEELRLIRREAGEAAAAAGGRPRPDARRRPASTLSRVTRYLRRIAGVA